MVWGRGMNKKEKASWTPVCFLTADALQALASSTWRQALTTFKPGAKVNPANKVLQSDVFATTMRKVAIVVLNATFVGAFPPPIWVLVLFFNDIQL